ncbi:MAG: hypothetical protein LUE86_10245 [Clostridiales bacterium]|nr:hypothetical protein [Clostridiales bacterium]
MAVYENGKMRAESPVKDAITPEKNLQYQQAQQQRETKEYLSYKESITRAKKMMASMEENWKIPVIGRIIQFFQKGKHEELGALADAGNQKLKDLSASIAARGERMEALKKEIPQREINPVKDLKSLAKTNPQRFQKEVVNRGEEFLRENYNDIWEFVTDATKEAITERFPDFARDFDTAHEGKDILNEMAKEGMKETESLEKELSGRESPAMEER